MADCRIHPEVAPVEDAILDGLRELSASVVSDSMDRLGALSGLHLIGPTAGRPVPLVGRAFTVRVDAGDNLALHVALDLVRPGDVLVIDAAGHVDRAITGELMVTYAASRGALGVIVDGAVRDAELLAGLDVLVYARGVTHLGPRKVGSGELRGAVVLGGTTVHQGDVIVGDGDGLVRVPRGQAADVLRIAREREAGEETLRGEIAEGRYPRPWLDDAVRLVPVDQAAEH